MVLGVTSEKTDEAIVSSEGILLRLIGINDKGRIRSVNLVLMDIIKL